MADVECQKAVVAKLLGYLVILGSLTVKAPQVRRWNTTQCHYIRYQAYFSARSKLKSLALARISKHASVPLALARISEHTSIPAPYTLE